jgi:hypothetical protein
MDINVKIIRDNKSFDGQIDIDSDIFSKVPLCNKCSKRIKPLDGSEEFYVTEIYDLFTNYEEVVITKLKR